MASPQPITWIRKDYHVHESHSSDAPGATVERYCRMAERRGIDEIAFTTHLILTGPDVEHGVSPEKIPEYLDEIEAARGDTTVELRSGLEIDYFPEVERRIESVLDEHSLDFVLGSLHYIRGIDIGSRRNSPRFFAGRPLEESLDVYFDGFREAIESGLFDAMAHPDYFRKFLHLTRPEPATWEEYGTMIYEALDSLRSHGVGISVNSSGWRHGIGDVYPIRELLGAAYKAGVEKITVGSDSHSIEDLGVNTVKAVKRLEEAGYSHLCIFEKRRNRKVSLADVIDVKPRMNLIP
jgi:histidinol-phosphatase (PHP family)